MSGGRVRCGGRVEVLNEWSGEGDGVRWVGGASQVRDQFGGGGEGEGCDGRAAMSLMSLEK